MGIFDKRSEQAELMDDLDCEGEVIDKTLRELEIINTWLGGNNVTLSGLSQVCKNISEDKEISIADIGCGGGDMLKLIARWAAKNSRIVRLSGIDANKDIIRYAEKNCSGIKEISFQSINIFSEEFKKQRYDVVTSTLFCHHFTDAELVNLLRQLGQQAKYGIIINDLHRHWFAYYSIKGITNAFSNSYMVKNDACISVLRAFKEKELKKIIEAAGYSKYTIRWKWAFRFEVVINV